MAEPMTQDEVIRVLADAVLTFHRRLEASVTPEDSRLADLRALFTAHLQRIEEVLTVKVQLLQIEVQRLEARVRHLESPPT